MAKRSKQESPVVQTSVAEVAPVAEVAEVKTDAPAKKEPVYQIGSVSASKLRADYVKAAWDATVKILPATEAQIAALPEFKPELLKGGRVSGYLKYWTKRGFLSQQ